MKLREHLELDQNTGAVDVQVLDVLAEVEALLRDAREIQRHILRVRGVPKRANATERRAAASRVRQLARKMSNESAALSEICKELEREFPVIAALASRILGPILWWTSLCEERRLARGHTYDPATIIVRRNCVET